MNHRVPILLRCPTSARTFWKWFCCTSLLLCLTAHAQTAKSASTPAPANTAYSKLASAESAMEKQQWASAERTLLELTTGKDYVARAWFDLGYVYHATGRRSEAVEAYRKAVAANPTAFESNLNLGLLLVGTDDAEAAKYLKAATALKPTTRPEHQMSRAWFGLGRALADSDPAAAQSALQKGLALDSKDVDAHLELGDLLGRANDWAGAEKQFEAASELDPKSADAQAMLANAYMRQNKFPQAEAALQKFVAANPKSENGHLQLGRVLIAEQKYDEAQLEFQKALELKPDDTDALAETASLALARKQYPEAEAASRKLLERNPQNAHLHQVLGSALMHQKKWKEAETELIKAVSLQPDFGGAYGDLALVFSEEQNYPAALKALDHRAKYLPETPGTLYLRATQFDNLKDFKTASQFYKQFLAASNGRFPDEEWKAKHRLIAIDPETRSKAKSK